MSDLKVVDFTKKRSEEEEKSKEEAVKDIREAMEIICDAIKEDRIEQFLVAFEAVRNEKDHEEHGHYHSMILHYNKDRDNDKALGYAERVKQRIYMITEGLLE